MEVTKMERLEYCYECNKDVNPTIKTEKNKYTYRGKEFLVIEDVHYCPNCGNILINDNFDSDMYKIYNCYLNLFDLSFEKIKLPTARLSVSNVTCSLLFRLLQSFDVCSFCTGTFLLISDNNTPCIRICCT